MMKHHLLSNQVVLVVVGAVFTMGADWTQFRGPGGLGISQDKGLPVQWSSDLNIVWKTRIPGSGTSSPVTLGNRVFLTSYSGYGLDANDPGDMSDLTRHVLCLDRKTGQILWSQEFQPSLPESVYAPGNDSKHGYSSSTPTTDGQRLYVFFGKSGLYCLDLDGNQLWHEQVGSGTTGWGSSNSPLLYKDLVIINASVESQSLIAMDKKTGEEVWRTNGVKSSWNTPTLVPLATGKTELVVSIEDHLLGFDPDTGDALWNAEGIHRYVCPSVIAHQEVVYAIGGGHTSVAVRAGGQGEVTETHVIWRENKGSNVSSPIYHGGYLYWASDNQGILYCQDAASGQVMYQERLSPRPGFIYASPILADGKLYYVSQENGTYVVAAKSEFQLLAHNVFANDDSRANASPAVSDGQLLIRTDRNLYCIGQK